ncbi:MAG: hypothetical protein HC929_06930 [Leptolyngbyaceae cyanobacterium SM2_5_2]|nr:hypothetical protein [Leptolyngbyaceae cyanobacterium SM2_5_2]
MPSSAAWIQHWHQRYVLAPFWKQNDMISAFVRAYDLGGTVYEGEDSYPSLEAALLDLEAGIKAYLDENGI